MRARIPRSLLLSLLVLLLAAVASVQAQIHGTPPSVTSFGFGGNFNPAPGVPASVTSLGPNGFGNGPLDCCFGQFLFDNHQGFGGRRGHDNHSGFGEQRGHDHHRFPVGISVPVYVPYAVPYPVAYNDQDTADDESVDVDYTSSHGVPRVYDRGPWYHDAAESRQAPREAAPKAGAAPPTPAEPEPVVAQPNTVLIFKDGHRSEVQNYAIVGNTLFDFAEGRSRKILLADLDLPATQKANDDRGVDFHVPAKTAQVNQKK
ncbi:MAG: hypothetical protein LAO56_22705 [Acidobacteriia bacterium]|nr:hypothetical protein [Terriglobia bacterium]